MMTAETRRTLASGFTTGNESTDNGPNGLQALGRQLMGAAPATAIDWETVVALAQWHDVSPYLYWRLRHSSEANPSIPLTLWEMLRADYFACVVRDLMVERQLARILEAFAVAEVPAVVVKGAALAALYPAPATRVYGDLDLLLPQAMLAQAEATLEALGYQCAGHHTWWQDHHFHLPPMEGDTLSLPVELHWRLDGEVRAGHLPVEDLGEI